MEVLKTFPDGSIDCVITSPPYWNLRNYGVQPTIWDGRPDCVHDWNSFTREGISGGTKSKKVQIKGSSNFQLVESTQQAFCSKCSAWRGCLGLEPTFWLFIKHLAEIFDEIKRVLKASGTVWIVLGDTYSTQSGQNRDTMKVYSGYKSIRLDNKMIGVPLLKSKELPSKCLCQIPSRLAIEMSSRRWILRNELIWFKPNSMPSSARDRFTVDFEKVLFFTKSTRYYFEQQFEPYAEPMRRWGGEKLKAKGVSKWDHGTGQKTYRERNMRNNPLGKNMRCVWKIPTKAHSFCHFAVFPEKLIEPMVRAGCPEFVCNRCGNPNRMVGGSDCGCSVGFSSGIVLDPFCGSGTTLVVAKKLGRRWIGIDIKQEYVEMARTRLSKVPERIDSFWVKESDVAEFAQ